MSFRLRLTSFMHILNRSYILQLCKVSSISLHQFMRNMDGWMDWFKYIPQNCVVRRYNHPFSMTTNMWSRQLYASNIIIVSSNYIFQALKIVPRATCPAGQVTWKSTCPAAKPTCPAFLYDVSPNWQIREKCVFCLHFVFSGYFMLFWY